VARWYHWTGAAYHSDYPATSDGVGRSCRHERISGQFLLNSSKLRAEINSEPSRREEAECGSLFGERHAEALLECGFMGGTCAHHTHHLCESKRG
jgi:hypothetical protein